MKHAMRILVALCVLPVVVACEVTVTKDEDSIQQVQRVERQRFAAMTSQNVTALEPLLADELYYCHSNGEVQTKQQLLEALRSGELRYESIDLREFHVRQYRDVALGSGLVNVRASQGGAPPVVLDMRYVDAYLWRDGRWQLATWQSTRLPAAAR